LIINALLKNIFASEKYFLLSVNFTLPLVFKLNIHRIMILISDCGSTKADWRMITSSDEVKQQSTRGFNPFIQDTEAIEKILLLDFDDSFKKSEISKIYFYGAGCSDEYRNNMVATALKNVFPKTEIKVNHDLLASARALCGTSPGIACILGTGSNSCLYDGIEVIDNVTNMGSLMGDEGSGYHLGKELLRGYFYREMPKDILEAFEIFCPIGKRGILNKTYDNPTPNVYLASFTKFLSQNKSHPYVQNIVFQCFDEFITKHVQKYEGNIKLNINFVGSIAFHFQEILESVLASHNLKMGKIIQKPINSLVDFHIKMAAKEH